LISLVGGWPKKRLYSQLNWLGLPPISNAALAASNSRVSIRIRAAEGDVTFEIQAESSR